MANAYPGVRECIRKALEARKVAESSLDISIASLATATLKQYNTALKAWWSFCQTTGQPVYFASPEVVLDFLARQFQTGLFHGSLNSFRSAIALLLGPSLGTDEQIHRLFRGVFRLRPSRPKYNISWDPSIVLDYLCLLGPTESLSIEQLTYKTVSLLALTTAHRVQTLAAIDIRNVTTTPRGLDIRISALLKTSGPNRQQPVLHLPFFHRDRGICPATTVRAYLERTADVRPRDESKLLISFKRPYHGVSSQTLSRWIKKTLLASGLDTTVFTAHSTRHAATSTAQRHQVRCRLVRAIFYPSVFL